MLVEVGVDLEQLPPGAESAAGIGLDDGAAGDHIDEVVVGAVAVDDDHLLEAVIGQTLGNAEDVLDKVLVVDVERAGEVHHVARVSVAHGWQDQHFFWSLLTCSQCDLGRANKVHIQR